LKVGVFVDASASEIIEMVDAYELDLVQLHGNETPEFCADLMEEIEVIKTIHLSENEKTAIDKLIKPYDEASDYYLFDTMGAGGQKGGTGQKFDWKKLEEADIEKPFFLSGGIGPDDVAAIKSFSHPDFFAIDVNSRFEKEPGVKDMALLLPFVQAFKKIKKK
jgi:phosphoribosylanthranilate isomerase